MCRYKYCDIEHNFGEFGIYDVKASDEASINAHCDLRVVLEPVNIYLRNDFTRKYAFVLSHSQFIVLEKVITYFINVHQHRK